MNRAILMLSGSSFLKAQGAESAGCLITVCFGATKTIEIAFFSLNFPNQFHLGLTKRLHTELFCHRSDFVHFHTIPP